MVQKLELGVELEPLISSAPDQETVASCEDLRRPILSEGRLLCAFCSQKMTVFPITKQTPGRDVADDELPPVGAPGHGAHPTGRGIERDGAAGGRRASS